MLASAFLALVLLYLVLATLGATCTLYLCFRLFKSRTSFLRCVLICTIHILLAIGMIEIRSVRISAAATLAVAAGLLLAVYLTVSGFGRASWKRAILVFLCYFVASIPVSVGLGFGVSRRFMQGFRVPTGAMTPTIEPGDYVIADLLSSVHRWDLIVFKAPMEPTVFYVKRLIGLPGETVEVVNGEILINGAIAPKPPDLAWLHHDGTMTRSGQPGHGCTGSPIKLGTDEFYVLGDNTKVSLDSRLWGPPVEPGPQPGAVPRHYIKGVVRMIYAPFDRLRQF